MEPSHTTSREPMTEREARIQTVCLTILATLALGWVLYWSRPVAIPFVVSLVVVLALASVVDRLERRLHFPHWLAQTCALVIGLAILTSLGFLFSVAVAALVENATLYQSQIRILIDNGLASLPLEYFGIDPSTVMSQMPIDTIGPMLAGIGNALLGVLSQGLLVVVFVVFLLLSGGGRDGGSHRGVWGKISQRVQRYIVVKILISAGTAISVYTVLTILDVPLALVFGLLTFLLNFIPSVGSIVAVLLPIPVVLVDPNIGTLAAILAIALPGAIQLTFGNFIEPKVLGESLELHPAVILISLVIWGMIWGIVGMFLAAPMTATIKIILERMEHTKPIADLLGGRVDTFLGDD